MFWCQFVNRFDIDLSAFVHNLSTASGMFKITIKNFELMNIYFKKIAHFK